MSNIDKRGLRDIASAAKSTPLWHAVGVFGEVVDPANPEWKPVHDFCKTFTAERVLALLDELEAKDAKIANLTAERDALREGEMGDAKHSNTRAAADIYFQLVEEYEIPAGGSLVEYVSDLRERAAAGKGEANG